MPEIINSDIVYYCPKGKEGGWGTHYHIKGCKQIDKTYKGIRYSELMGLHLPYHGDRYVPCQCVARYMLMLDINGDA